MIINCQTARAVMYVLCAAICYIGLSGVRDKIGNQLIADLAGEELRRADEG